MLSWGFEVSAHRSGGTERGDDPQSRVDRPGTGLGVGWVLKKRTWRCPESVAILPVVDLNVTVRLALAWRRDNTSPLLANFFDEVRLMPDVRTVKKG